MPQPILIEFARFLKAHEYSTRMWDRGYTPDDSNGVCHEMSKWVQETWKLPGEFLMLWSSVDGTRFSGDSELVYFIHHQAYLVPNPFIEGDAEGFVVALATIVEDGVDALYSVPVSQRILYNAV